MHKSEWSELGPFWPCTSPRPQARKSSRAQSPPLHGREREPGKVCVTALIRASEIPDFWIAPACFTAANARAELF